MKSTRRGGEPFYFGREVYKEANHPPHANIELLATHAMDSVEQILVDMDIEHGGDMQVASPPPVSSPKEDDTVPMNVPAPSEVQYPPPTPTAVVRSSTGGKRMGSLTPRPVVQQPTVSDNESENESDGDVENDAEQESSPLADEEESNSSGGVDKGQAKKKTINEDPASPSKGKPRAKKASGETKKRAYIEEFFISRKMIQSIARSMGTGSIENGLESVIEERVRDMCKAMLKKCHKTLMLGSQRKLITDDVIKTYTITHLGF